MDLAALIYHRQAFLDGQWWLPLSAQWVHLNVAHGVANLAAALLLGVFLRGTVRWQQQLVLVGSSALAVALGVVLDTQCSYYAGASGALYGLAAGGSVLHGFGHSGLGRRQRLQGVVVLGLLSARLLIAQWGADTPVAWGIPVYVPAHWAGVGGGLLAAIGLMRCQVVRVTPSRETKQPQ